MLQGFSDQEIVNKNYFSIFLLLICCSAKFHVESIYYSKLLSVSENYNLYIVLTKFLYGIYLY